MNTYPETPLLKHETDQVSLRLEGYVKRLGRSDIDPPKTDTKGAPSWVKDLLEASDLEERRRATEELEEALPGLREGFDLLMAYLPSPNDQENTEFPVAAGVFMLDEKGDLMPVASAHNEVNKRKDSTAHAEIVALQEAQEQVGDKHLEDCVLVATHELCAMCTGAVANTKVGAVVSSLTHENVEGTYALVRGEYKRFRTSGGAFNSKGYLGHHNIPAISGYRREEAFHRVLRTPISIGERSEDPDAG